MANQRTRLIGTLTFAMVGTVASHTFAQAAPGAPAPPAAATPPAPAAPPAGEPPTGATPTPGAEASAPPTTPPPAAAESSDAEAGGVAPVTPTVFPPPALHRRPKKKKPKVQRLYTTVGMLPTDQDFGSEADMVSTANAPHDAPLSKKWNYSLRGFLRAPMRIGIGPRTDRTSGTEWHAPAHMPGATSDEWNYTGVAPGPNASLYFNVENNTVSGNLILATNTFFDSGYKHLDQIGGISQAYITFKWADAFGDVGGLALTAGAFSNRYGTSGPMQQSSGFYGTYLFGRTHVAGLDLAGDFHLAKDLDLVVEEGFGAKLEVVPWASTPPTEPYLPYQGPVPQGSNFVHHSHVALIADQELRIGAHYLTSWSTNDCPNDDTCPSPGTRVPIPRETVIGADIHVDDKIFGNAYLGFSRTQAAHVLPLSNGLEVIHSSYGYDLQSNYFNINPATAANPTPDHGIIQTVLAQYIVRLSPLLGQTPGEGPDVALGLYGMYNHVTIGSSLKQDKYKGGAEVEVSPLRFLSVGLKYDRVMPDGSRTAPAYSAISPRLIMHTNWLSREYVILNYTHYTLGSAVPASELHQVIADNAAAAAVPGATNITPFSKPDPDLISLTAVVAF
ncbi:MAG TPA: hypothetical protein VGI10_03015 [Polyangiaceae bacterium]|jgi:hypothetical protein